MRHPILDSCHRCVELPRQALRSAAILCTLALLAMPRLAAADPQPSPAVDPAFRNAKMADERYESERMFREIHKNELALEQARAAYRQAKKYLTAQQPAKAERELRLALQTMEIYIGRAAETADVQHQLANALLQQDKLEEGPKLAESALQIYRRELGSDHKVTLYTLVTLGRFQMLRSEWAASRASFTEALQGCERSNVCNPKDVELLHIYLQALEHTDIQTSPALLQAQAAGTGEP